MKNRKSDIMEKLKGKVKWFNNKRGYGFIVVEGYSDIFIHYSKILNEGYKTLNEGDIVEFNLIETEKGLQAENIQLIVE